MIKINSLEIHGLRGIKANLSIDLKPGKSLLIFGDNGSGKSSITDAIEWFYYDKVEHLVSEEIGRKGHEALRNLFLDKKEKASIGLKFSDSSLDRKKELFYEFPKVKLTSAYDKNDENCLKYWDESQKEKLILQYRNLGIFILKSKKEKLEDISEIIGFGKVTKTRGDLKRVLSRLESIIKIKNFDAQISSRKDQITGQLKQHVHNDEQFFAAVQEIVAPLNLGISITRYADINSVIEKIKQPEDKEKISIQISYERVIGNLNVLKGSLDSLDTDYKTCRDAYKKIIKDANKLKKIRLESLLDEGLQILAKGYFEEDKCPLCLQDVIKEELIATIRQRIEELESLKKEKDKFVENLDNLKKRVNNQESTLRSCLSESCLQKNTVLKEGVEKRRSNLIEFSKKLEKMMSLDKDTIKETEESMGIKKDEIESLIESLKKSKEKVVPPKKDDLKYSILEKLISTRENQLQINKLLEEKLILESQHRTIEIIYNDFVKKQQQGFCAFLGGISKEINELYCYMNPSEKIEGIEFLPLTEDDELLGITLQFKYYNEVVSPPNRYLSESHLNCLGICLFLSSVKAFNKKNGFFILDDVISSFDTRHRSRFAKLLDEKFSDYQIFLFTHEPDWYELVRNRVKGKNWEIKSIKWDDENGATLDEPLSDLYERIKDKIDNNNPADLGNMLRKYLENLLKDICCQLGVKVAFQYNETNEERAPGEMILGLRHALKENKCELKDSKIASSSFLGNITSHDSKFKENIDDLKLFHDEIVGLKNFFHCDKCDGSVSLKHYDSVNKKIRCKCKNNAKEYTWEL